MDRRSQLLRLLVGEDEPLARLVAADALQRELRILVRDLAQMANASGHSWAAIGEALGVSRATVHERFSDGHARSMSRRRRPC